MGSAVMVFLIFSQVAGAWGLTLPELLDLGLAHNQEIAAARTSIAGAKAARLHATAPLAPKLGVGEMDRTMRTSYFLIEQELEFPVKSYLRYGLQDQEVEKSSAEYEHVLWRIKGDLKKRYFALVMDEKRRQFNRANWRAVQEFARAAEKRYASGRSGKHDSMRAHVELTRLEVENLKLEGLVEEHRWALWHLVDGHLPEGWKLPSQFPSYPPLDQEKWRRLSESSIIRQSPVWRQQQANLRSAQMENRFQEWNWAPDIGFSLRSGNAPEIYEAMLTLTVPLWFWGPSAAISKARANLLAAEYTMTDRERSLLAQLHSLRSAVERWLKTLRIYETSLIPQAQTSYQFAVTSYRAARGDLADFLQSEKDLYEVNNNYFTEIQDYIQRVVELEALLGEELVLWSAGGEDFGKNDNKK